MAPSLPASPPRLSLRALRDSHIEKLLLEAAEMRRVPVDNLPQEVHQILRAEAVKLANERIEFLRQHGDVKKPAGNPAAPRSAETSTSERERGAFIKAESLPGSPALVTVPTAQPQGIDSHQPVETAAPPFSSSPFAPEIFFASDTTTTMSFSDLFGNDLSEEELLAALSPALLQHHPQVFNDPTQLATQSQTQDMDHNMWSTNQDPFVGNDDFDQVESSPVGVMQSSPLAHKSSDFFAQDNMNVALDNDFIAQGDQHNFGTDSPAPTFQAGNMPAQSFPSGPAFADLNQVLQPNNNQANFPNHRNLPVLEAADPWANDPPATDPELAKARFMFHSARFNDMHEIRKQTNEKYMMSYLLQGQYMVEAIISYVGLQLGFNTANDIIGKYQTTNDLRELLHLITHVRAVLVPKLVDVGPARMRNSLYAFVRNINDPQYKISCWNHVTTALYQMFCGVKGFMLMIDRHREQNPDPYKALPGFKFETYFTVTREQFWAWLAPAREDKELGEYDHWFGN